MNRMVLRMDDFDPRIDLKTLKPLHEEFVKRNLVMTVAINNSMGHRMNFDQDVLNYVNKETPPETWDIQLHSYDHDRLWTFPYPQIFANLFTNLNLTRIEFPRSNPTIFYPPWNQTSDLMNQACEELGLTVKTTNWTIREMMWDGRSDQDLFFWHWWTKDDRDILPEALDRLIMLNEKRGFK